MVTVKDFENAIKKALEHQKIMFTADAELWTAQKNTVSRSIDHAIEEVHNNLTPRETWQAR